MAHKTDKSNSILDNDNDVRNNSSIIKEADMSSGAMARLDSHEFLSTHTDTTFGNKLDGETIKKTNAGRIMTNPNGSGRASTPANRAFSHPEEEPLSDLVRQIIFGSGMTPGLEAMRKTPQWLAAMAERRNSETDKENLEQEMRDRGAQYIHHANLPIRESGKRWASDSGNQSKEH
ncbi:hypothetical protein PV10_05957 [Exophiala mesophila]|uniref:Uncharacterized protein n=1 Tax=Exophiala mesophila TaxID=212818 RepID=A0A0D1WQN8_EXOME|nr:uncharacterized protein PV10_05957 [Exophiala mesophila]KIV91415.1 hypothetical protein PV10_05957 [Exophiala mesophila]